MYVFYFWINVCRSMFLTAIADSICSGKVACEALKAGESYVLCVDYDGPGALTFANAYDGVSWPNFGLQEMRDSEIFLVTNYFT